MTFRKRAIHDDQKETRRQMILDAAQALLEVNKYDDISINQVARESGIAKGTVYLYFSTKEHLFLALVIQQLESLFEGVNHQLQAVDSTPQAVAHCLTQAFVDRPILTRLFAITHVILEHNIDRETALEYKYMLLENVSRTGAILEQKLPRLTSGAQLLRKTYALAIGVEHLANPAPIVRDIITTEPNMQAFEIKFGEMFESMLLAIIEGEQTHD